jgi:hypothetical protein
LRALSSRTVISLVPLLAALCASISLQEALADSAGKSFQTTTLYDGRLGTTPDQQGFDFLALPPATQIISGNTTILDTLADEADLAGYFSQSPQVPVLDLAASFTVVFTAALPAETHSSQNRAGFSILLLADDEDGSIPARGIELGFWPDQIWAYDDDTQGGTLFSRAESAPFDTRPLTRYELAFDATGYTLSAGGVVLLSGRLRDYSNFDGSLDPYETPNLVFLGDNTSSAAARLQLSGVSIRIPASDFKLFLPLVRG